MMRRLNPIHEHSLALSAAPAKLSNAFPSQIDFHSIQRSKEKVLHFSMKVLKGGLASALAATALMAVAGGASAAPAAWVGVPVGSPAATSLTGTLTVSETIGGASTTCTFGFPTSSTASNQTATQGYAFNVDGVACANGMHFDFPVLAAASKNAGAYSLTNTPNMSGQHPFRLGYSYKTTAWTVPFTNGSGSVASKLTFSNTQIGQPGSNSPTNLYATGVLTYTRTGGALIVLN